MGSCELPGTPSIDETSNTEGAREEVKIGRVDFNKLWLRAVAGLLDDFFGRHHSGLDNGTIRLQWRAPTGRSGENIGTATDPCTLIGLMYAIGAAGTGLQRHAGFF